MMRVLETSGYQARGRHEPGYIASRLGLDVEQERIVLTALEAAGVAQFRAGRYEVGEPLTVDTTAGATKSSLT